MTLLAKLKNRFINNAILCFQRCKMEPGKAAYYTAFLLMTGGKAGGLDSSSKVYNVLFLIAIALLLIKYFTTEYSVKERMLTAALVMISGVSMLKSGEKTVLFSILFIITAKGIHVFTLLKFVLAVRLVSTSVLMLLSGMGITGNYSIPYYTAHINELKETIVDKVTYYYSFGYAHPNICFISCFLIFIIFIFINYKKINWIYFAITGAGAVFVYTLTHSRTGLLVFLCFCLIVLLIRSAEQNNFVKQMIRLLIYSIPIAAVISVGAALLFDENSIVWLKINTVFTGRLHIMHEYLSAFTPSLLGTACEGLSSFLDNMYLSLLLKSGIILFLLFLLSQYLLSRQLYKENRYIELGVLCTFAIYGLMEEFPLNVIMNPFMLYTGEILFKSSNKIRGENG